MTPESLSIPIAPASDCCSEAAARNEQLPIVSSAGTQDACCASSAPGAPVPAEPASNKTHGDTCAHHLSPVVADDVASAPAETSPAATAEPAAGGDSAPVDDAALIDALREVVDPELMINIVDLGLVYSINHTDRKVVVEMTLTSPACPAGPQIISQAKMSLEKLSGVDLAEIKLTMSPPWTPDRMTDDARDQLGIF